MVKISKAQKDNQVSMDFDHEVSAIVPSEAKTNKVIFKDPFSFCIEEYCLHTNTHVHILGLIIILQNTN